MSAPALRIVCTFHSSPPRREATPFHTHMCSISLISIHASPKGGDT